MKQVGNYNKVPDTMKGTPLKKGQLVLYRLLNPVVDPSDPKKEKLIWPMATKIPSLDVVSDPATGAPIEIGVVDRVDRNNIPTIKSFWVKGSANNGYFTLTGGQGYDDYFYWLFELSNYNLTNKKRDESVTPLFQRIDRAAEAKTKLKKRDEELDALIYVRDMDDKALRLLAASMSWDEKEESDILRDKANELAKADPKKFGAIVRSKDVEVKAYLKRAQDAQVISFDPAQNKVTWTSNGDTIATLPRVEGVDWLTGMTDWIKSSKNGDTTYAAIRKQLDATAQPAAEARKLVEPAKKEDVKPA